MKTIGTEIRERRKKLKLKVFELAEKVGVKAVYITQIEKHNKLPSPTVFTNIAEILGLSFDLKRRYYKEKFPEAYQAETSAHELFLIKYSIPLWNKDYKPAAMSIFHTADPSYIPTETDIEEVINLLKAQREVLVKFDKESKAGEKIIDSRAKALIKKQKS